MNNISTIISYIQSVGASNFINIVSNLFSVLMAFINGDQAKMDALLAAKKKYEELGDVTALSDLINK